MPKTVEINGKEITNPFLKWAIIVGAVVVVTLVICVLVMFLQVFVAILMMALVVIIPLHFILRLAGRHGFIKYHASGFAFTINANSFRRR